MKRTSTSLVSYSSSEDEESRNIPPHKKKRLPSLSSSIIVPAPIDNPALHQGRVRITPHVEGQYPAYIYVSVTFARKSTFYTLIEQAFRYTKRHVPSAHPIGIHCAKSDKATGTTGLKKADQLELHISLSRPIFLRAHQRDDLKHAIKHLAGHHRSFKGSFATFAELTNDERTRTFLTLEVGAGHGELKKMVDKLDPILRSIRQKEFYNQPRFHASFAWALLEDVSSKNILQNSNTVEPLTSSVSPMEMESSTNAHSLPTPPSAPEISLDEFNRIPRFPDDLIPSLNENFGENLTSPRIGSFDVASITMKIGKDIYTFPLEGTMI
ncbi:U6 snRNA phosphodiesterase Usb1 [Hygrophoropsis aurantiaca]|uniref:U6 snRNA phosphodiesterase Usb1 n=1 Tax=Hygrophoropsis aurantiaca TaxID=72124 RepID=A0ACB8ALI7_9AGAM|nr:U6 snRNA phosphodiesterase Usb1 [Hygrophoropsis aurantiaca]